MIAMFSGLFVLLNLIACAENNKEEEKDVYLKCRELSPMTANQSELQTCYQQAYSTQLNECLNKEENSRDRARLGECYQVARANYVQETNILRQHLSYQLNFRNDYDFNQFDPWGRPLNPQAWGHSIGFQPLGVY